MGLLSLMIMKKGKKPSLPATLSLKLGKHSYTKSWNSDSFIEQGHREIKRLTKHMLRLKDFYSASVTLAGIEIVNMIKKGQIQSQRKIYPNHSANLLFSPHKISNYKVDLFPNPCKIKLKLLQKNFSLTT